MRENAMNKVIIVAATLLVAITACAKTDTTPVDSALSISPSPQLDSIAAIEQTQAPALAAPATVPARTSTGSAPRRSTSTRRTSSTSSGSSASSSSGTTTSSSGGTYTKKNTKRDAAIGAAAGAIIGATTSHDKVKGAVIGGVVGGVVGGVIGNNVDVQKKKK
jgi:hypothetical protein